MFLLFLALIFTCKPDQTVYKILCDLELLILQDWSDCYMFSQSPFHLFFFFFNLCSSSPPLSQPDKIVVKISPPLVVIFQHLIHFWRLIANDWDGWDQDLTTFDMFATHFFDKCLSNGMKLGDIFIWRIDNKRIRYLETMLPSNTLTSCLFF